MTVTCRQNPFLNLFDKSLTLKTCATFSSKINCESLTCFLYFCYMYLLDCPCALWLARLITSGFLLQHSLKTALYQSLCNQILLSYLYFFQMRRWIKIWQLLWWDLKFLHFVSWVLNMAIELKTKDKREIKLKANWSHISQQSHCHDFLIPLCINIEVKHKFSPPSSNLTPWGVTYKKN